MKPQTNPSYAHDRAGALKPSVKVWMLHTGVRHGMDTQQPARGQANGALRVAVMDDYVVIVSGVQQMLAPYERPGPGGGAVSMLPVESEIDVLLYDTYSRERVTGPVEQVIKETDANVVLYTWHLEPELVAEALAKGAAGCLSKSLEGDDLVAALERVHRGEVVVSDDPGPDAPVTPEAWPGKEHGLSPRESEIIALIAQGLSNQEVAERAFLSINSVKTFIRSAYRKIGVQRRTQAVLWATEHGFVPRPSSTILAVNPEERRSSVVGAAGVHHDDDPRHQGFAEYRRGRRPR